MRYKEVTSGAHGAYSFFVFPGWSGTLTPVKEGFTFSPTERTYTDVLANQAEQDFTANPILYTISGKTGTGGVTLNYTDGEPKTAAADASGNYSFTVSERL